jgi:ATP-dependent DNA helicase RecQ
MPIHSDVEDARCLGRPIVASDFSAGAAIDAGRFLRHSETPLECNKQVAKDAFAEYGFRGNLPDGLRAEPGRILSRWGDAGWGQIVAEDKQNGHFRDDLVEAVADMIRNRWRPAPAPAWITCIPSRNHPTLVSNFSGRLANRLGLQLILVVIKIKDNEPQKEQQNRFHQCRNLDGVFGIDGEVSDGPVLLVDDVADSAWTLTVAAALLRRAGSGPVWPLALTTSSMAT